MTSSWLASVWNCFTQLSNKQFCLWLVGLQGPLPGVVPPTVTGPSIQAQLYHLEQHYHLQKEILNRQFEEDQRLLEHEKQQYKMQVCMLRHISSRYMRNKATNVFGLGVKHHISKNIFLMSFSHSLLPTNDEKFNVSRSYWRNRSKKIIFPAVSLVYVLISVLCSTLNLQQVFNWLTVVRDCFCNSFNCYLNDYSLYSVLLVIIASIFNVVVAVEGILVPFMHKTRPEVHYFVVI